MSDTPPGCRICRNLHVDAIDERLREGSTYAEVIEEFGLHSHPDSLASHALCCADLPRYRGIVKADGDTPPCEGYVPAAGQRYCGVCAHRPDCDRLGRCKGCPASSECMCWNPEEMRYSEHQAMQDWRATAVKCGPPPVTALRGLRPISECMVSEREKVLA